MNVADDASGTNDEAAQLRARVGSLEQLLQAQERTVADKTTRLDQALAAVGERSRQLATSELAFQTQASILQSVLHSMSDGVVVADEHGRFLLFNAAAERILGIGLTDAPPEEWAARYGCYLPDMVTPFAMDQLPLVRAVRGEQVDEAEIFIRNPQVPDGVWLSVNARPLHTEDGNLSGGVAVFRDVTARKRAEQRMAAQHAVTHVLAGSATLAEATPRILQALGKHLNALVGAIWDVNQAVHQIRCVEFWHSPDVDVAEFEAASRQGAFLPGIGLPGTVWATGQPTWIPDITKSPNFPRGPTTVRSCLRGAFGFPIRMGEEVLGVIEFFSRSMPRPDQELLEMFMTIGSQIGQFIERKRAEERLRDSEALYHSLVECLPLNIFRKDLHGRFTFGNHLFCATVGKPLNDILGKTDFDFYPPALAEKFRQDDQRVVDTQQVFEDIEENRTPDGTKTYVQVLKTAVHDSRRNVVGIQGIFWDVTDRRRAEEELKRTAMELGRSNSDLEQFAYVASHDLQEPLRMVSSYCQLLQRRYRGKLDADADDFLNYAMDGATRMQGLINDLLAYSRVGTKGKPLRPTPAAEVVARAQANLRAAIAESQAVIAVADLPTVMGDETQLVQLFQNLIGNAIKFRGAEPPRVQVAAERRGDEWVFSVRDNGIGIDPQFSERIFVIFQRLHGRGEYPGTGIGLAVCKKIIERHGGRIWVRSQPGQGCTFFFTLPLGGAEAP